MNQSNFDLDKSLIGISTNTFKGHWTIRQAVEGVQIFGGIGSGKTSGSGKKIALKYLKAGFGGLVLTVKPDEKELWQDYCRLAGREEDLLILEPDGKYHFNFLQYESTQSGKAFTENIVDVLKTVIRAGEEKNNSGSGDNAFWDNALEMLISNTIDLCQLAYNHVSLQMLYDIIQTVPKSKEELHSSANSSFNDMKAFEKAFELAKCHVNNQINVWTSTLSSEVKSKLDEQDFLNGVPDARLLWFLDHFFNETLINLNDRTRSIIEFTVSGFLFKLLREPFYSLFSRYDSNISPEDCLDGKIILINTPVKIHQKVGRDIQILCKYVFQKAWEKRSIKDNERPLFLWADEAQYFLHEQDALFQATARSSRIATVYISQNLPNYYASMGGQKAEYRVKSFIGTLGTKIFHANADIETNKYASELIGDAYFVDETLNVTMGNDMTHGKGKSLKLERVVRQEDFNRLRTGGPQNDYIVEGYMHRQGDSPFEGMNHRKMSFNQNDKS